MSWKEKLVYLIAVAGLKNAVLTQYDGGALRPSRELHARMPNEGSLSEDPTLKGNCRTLFSTLLKLENTNQMHKLVPSRLRRTASKRENISPEIISEGFTREISQKIRYAMNVIRLYIIVRSHIYDKASLML